MTRSTLNLAVAALALAACNGPRTVREQPILQNGDRVRTGDAAVADAAVRLEADRDRAAAARDSIAASAAASCAGDVCAALTRGEVWLGMNGAQVIAATRTSPEAWTIRGAGNATVMTPRTLGMAPKDVVGELGVVQLVDGRVTWYSYREPTGLRVVTRKEEASTAGRARAIAEALVREGDDYNAAGDRAKALDRYDRAIVLLPDDAMLQYKVATLLDLQLRPVEALMRYQRFLQTLELQRIQAVGEAAARQAEAIALAQQRIIVLQRDAR